MTKQTNKKVKASRYITVIFILVITVIICIAYIILLNKMNDTIYVFADTSKQDIENNNKNKSNSNNIKKLQTRDIDITQIISNNTRTVKKEEISTKQVELEYTTKYTNNPNLPKGMLQVLQEGINGEEEIYIKKIYEGDKLLGEEQIGSKVIKSSINKMVVIGTGDYANNYKVKVGDNIYVTTSLLAVRVKADDYATKLISLSKNTKVKLLQKKEEWYKIKYQSYIGWAKAECFTYLEPNSKEENNNANNKYTKQQLLNKLSFNMELNKPSGLSLEQFKKIFNNEPKDKQNIFKNNAQYFYYAEKQYNINGVFLAAIAIHESGWGGSSIAVNKNNLFGYGAYDEDPYGNAYQFYNYSEGIDLLARVLVKYYLNPKGTKIYDGTTAIGTYYNGATVSGVNIKYATDKNWANGVYNWMKYLYNRL